MSTKLNLIIFSFLLLCILASCLGGGTHGSIKTYQYPISKYTLDSTVQKVIASNPNIQIDTIKNYYNDEHTYVTIKITQPDGNYEYTFRYGGDTTYWDTSRNLSDLFICYAWDQNKNGGSEGDGGVSWHHWGLKQALIRAFETEFISRLDSALNLKYTEPD